MTSRALLLLSLLSISVAGCAVLEPIEKPSQALVNPPASASEAVVIAREQAARGRWGHALQTLQHAERLFPDGVGLAEERAEIELRRAAAVRLLEDQILVGDAENEQTKIYLLGKLSLANPDNLVLTSRRLYWKELLDAKAERLLACSEHHVKTTPTLAKRCFELAQVLADTEGAQARLTEVNAQLRMAETAEAEKRRTQQARERRLRAKVLLGNARAAIDARDYRRALDILEGMAELQPDNREVSDLQQEAWAMIGPQVEALVKLGDHLYLDEQLDAAVATWQAALNLKPEDEAIVARIERAQTVLQRLDALRRQQGSVQSKPE